MKKSDALLISKFLYQDEQMSDFSFYLKIRRIENGLMMITYSTLLPYNTSPSQHPLKQEELSRLHLYTGQSLISDT